MKAKSRLSVSRFIVDVSSLTILDGFYHYFNEWHRIYANPSQSNYAAGCVFQDTLARSRSVQGLHGSVSLDIGYMGSVGYVAQRSADSQVIRANAPKLVPIETDEFLEILDHYCEIGRAHV